MATLQNACSIYHVFDSRLIGLLDRELSHETVFSMIHSDICACACSPASSRSVFDGVGELGLTVD